MSRFPDVPANHWAYGVIEAAAAAGWVGGFEDGTFKPNDPVTRAQAVSMIGRATAYMHNRIQQIIAQCKPAVVKVMAQTPDGKTSLGAGAIISSDGYILTNEHVVMDVPTRQLYADLEVYVLTDGNAYEQTRAYPATVIAPTSNWDDLALIKITASGLPCLPLAKATPPEGTTVIAMGHPNWMQYTSTVGVVTQDYALLGQMLERMQTDAAINPGNSGGPMVDLDGRIVAVSQAKYSDMDNMGYGVRIEDVRTYLAKHLPHLMK